MRILILLLVSLSAHAAFDANDFVICKEFGFNAKYPTQYMNVWMNTYYQDELGLNSWPKNRWTPVDASGYVPKNAKAIFVSTVLIVTQGSVRPLTSNLTIAFRKHNAGSYTGKGNGWLNPSDYPSNPDLQTGSARYTQQLASVNDPSMTVGPVPRSNGFQTVPLDADGKYDIWIGVPAGAYIAPYAYYGLNVNIEGWCR